MDDCSSLTLPLSQRLHTESIKYHTPVKAAITVVKAERMRSLAGNVCDEDHIHWQTGQLDLSTYPDIRLGGDDLSAIEVDHFGGAVR